MINLLKKYIQIEIYNFKHEKKLKRITIIALIILYPITIPLGIAGLFIGIILGLMPEKKEYDKSIYKLITKKEYLEVFLDQGTLAEYSIWKTLNKQPEYKKVLINLYIPNKEHTAEIDVILINQHGIFVIESKSYSGWIFGKEEDKKWTQVIFNYKKRFYNPVIQNRNHIKKLAELLEIEDLNIFRSYIVFSNRCELKKVTANKSNLKIMNREQLENLLENDYERYGKVLTNEQIREINDKLFKYMFTDENVKNEHIEYVRKMCENQKFEKIQDI